MISSLLLNHFYPVVSYRRVRKEKRKRRIVVYGSVARYGPRTSCKGVNVAARLWQWTRGEFTGREAGVMSVPSRPLSRETSCSTTRNFIRHKRVWFLLSLSLFLSFEPQRMHAGARITESRVFRWQVTGSSGWGATDWIIDHVDT